MSKYQARKHESEEVAELEWLEDGVDFLVDTAVDCTQTIFRGLLQLLFGDRPRR